MDEYPDNWNEIRKQVYERDGYQCRNCGLEGGPKGEVELHAHHIVPNQQGGNHTKSNLATLCKHCHGKVHPHLDSQQTRETIEDDDVDTDSSVSAETSSENQKEISTNSEENEKSNSPNGLEDKDRPPLDTIERYDEKIKDVDRNQNY